MKNLIILLIAIFSFNNLSAQKYTTQYITDANKVGMQWWNEVNSGQYEKSYELLSDVLKNRFTKESWLNQISVLMDEFGQLEGRIVKDTYFQSELENFGNGFYVFVEYESEYTKTKNHTEFLLLKQSDQLKWEIFDFNYEFQSLDLDPDKL
jgi:hypothetical protein